MNFLNGQIEQIIAFRKDLHQTPELSGKEYKTTAKILEFISLSQPDEIIQFDGKTGLAVVFNGREAGKTILFRADIDALPIAETNTFGHRSKKSGISHTCGHDGHAAILAGLSRVLHFNPSEKGKVVLLFQPAEETGQGAKQMIKKQLLYNIFPDFVFALHNLPGFPLNDIVVKKDCFASASKGIIVKLFGETSHAAYPESGLSPAMAMTDIIRQLSEITVKPNVFDDFVLLTIVHSKLGKRTFGTAPGEAQVMATLRSHNDVDMEKLTKLAIKTITGICDNYGISEKITWTDEFPATINDPECVDIICNVASEKGFSINEIEKPFRWSEDFGHFTQKFRGALFGIGAGTHVHDLHQPDYDFNDEMIGTGIKIFDGIIRKIL